MFTHSRSSLKNHTRFQTKMDKVYTRFQTKTKQKPYNPLVRHIPVWLLAYIPTWLQTSVAGVCKTSAPSNINFFFCTSLE